MTMSQGQLTTATHSYSQEAGPDTRSPNELHSLLRSTLTACLQSDSTTQADPISPSGTLKTWSMKSLHTARRWWGPSRLWKRHHTKQVVEQEASAGCRVNLWLVSWPKTMLYSLETPFWISTSKIHRESWSISNALRGPSICRKPRRIRVWKTSLWKIVKVKRIKITRWWWALLQSAWTLVFISRVSLNIRKATRPSKQKTLDKRQRRC